MNLRSDSHFLRRPAAGFSLWLSQLAVPALASILAPRVASDACCPVIFWASGLWAAIVLGLLLSKRFRGKLRSKGPELLILYASVFLAALASEVALRVVLPGAASTIYRVDDRYIYSLIPNSRTIYMRRPSNGGQFVRVQINSRGYRGDELDTDPKLTRVVVYGDSFIEAQFSPLHETFTERLETKLRTEIEGPLEVVNAGVNGYGPDQVALRMEDEIETLRPALIVVAIYSGNDFGDLVRNKVFSIGNDGELTRNDFIISRRLRRKFSWAGARPLLARILLRWCDALPAMLTSVSEPGEERRERIASWVEICRREYGDYLVGGNREVRTVIRDLYDADVATDPDSESARYKRRLMEKTISKILHIAKAKDTRIALLVIPSPIDVCPAFDLATVDPKTYPRYRRSALTDAVQEAAERQGIPYLNLFAPFHKGQADDLFFHGGDNHWNGAGQDLAATLMKEFILSRNLLDHRGRGVRESDPKD